MEYMVGGTVSHALKARQFGEAEIAFICRECLKALEFIHYKQMVHQDSTFPCKAPTDYFAVKSSNIMLKTDGEVKLSTLLLCGIL